MTETTNPKPPENELRGLRRRTGPRPLPLHLASAMTTWLGSAAALPYLKTVSPPSSKPAAGNGEDPPGLMRVPWRPEVRAAAKSLAREAASVDPEAFALAVGREMRARLDALETGISRYRRHAYRRMLENPPAIWRNGTTRLLDYGTSRLPASDALPLLVVPSLVNRSYILDLAPGRSLMRFLAGEGFRPFLVDWDAPGPIERGFDLSDYIAGRLGAALDRVRARAGRPPVVVGYCMGGLLALALAQLRPADVSGLVLLATPWDFHADRPELARGLARAMRGWQPIVDRLGELPVDGLQALFFALDPFQVARKFCAFARLDPISPRANEFVALEDWLNDGVPLAARVAAECIQGWYGANTTAARAWRVAGEAIDPAKLDLPSFVLVPQRDRIVPPASATILGLAIRDATTLSPPLGHIGMVAAAAAAEHMWRPLVAWLATRCTGRL
jgi:polyhydroxyalkanoate synthase